MVSSPRTTRTGLIALTPSENGKQAASRRRTPSSKPPHAAIEGPVVQSSWASVVRWKCRRDVKWLIHRKEGGRVSIPVG